jgi:hypothetical protein
MVIDQRTTSLRGEAQDWESAFQKVTDGCKSCHRDFRARKEAPTISPIKKNSRRLNDSLWYAFSYPEDDPSM